MLIIGSTSSKLILRVYVVAKVSANPLLIVILTTLTPVVKVNGDIFGIVLLPSVTTVESILALASWYEILTVDDLVSKS